MTRAAIALLLGALLGGCSSPQKPAAFTVAPGDYPAAFDAAKEVLRDYRFELDRVDARAGVITTRPKTSGGLVSPWDREQSTLGQELEDTLNAQFRTVRITFEPADAATAAAGEPRPQAAPGPAPADIRLADTPLTARVQVIVERAQRPLWRVEQSAVFQSSFARDPDLARRVGGRYTVPFAQDTRLAGRVADAIARRAAANPAPQTTEPAADARSEAGSSAPAVGAPPGSVS